ncbi:hypothetical protein Plhal304r1_c002g0006631 [Plasmopara halstedii]
MLKVRVKLPSSMQFVRTEHTSLRTVMAEAYLSLRNQTYILLVDHTFKVTYSSGGMNVVVGKFRVAQTIIIASLDDDGAQ